MFYRPTAQQGMSAQLACDAPTEHLALVRARMAARKADDERVARALRLTDRSAFYPPRAVVRDYQEA